MKRRINKKYLVVLLILFISVGFAYLTSNLSITGLATIKRSVWDVHFENIVNENEDVLSIETPAQITNNRLRVEFEVSLDTPGEEYSFYVDVVNKSTFDVALDTLTISGLSQEQEAWIIPTVTYSDGISLQHNDILKENSLETLRVSVKYRDDLTENDLPTTDNDFTLTVELKYNQADSNSKERNHLEYITRQTPGVISVGDEIAIGSEHFYVVSSDEDKTVLLAKYNLNVGNYLDSNTKEGIQSSLAVGIYEGDEGNHNNRCGIVAFSNGTYWYDSDNNKIYDKYDNPNSNYYNIYDEDYNAASGDNYSIAHYVINYTQYLRDMGLDTKGRLLSFAEARYLLDNSYAFAYSTTYWLNNSPKADYTKVSVVYYTNNIYNNHYTSFYNNGVRPVIEMNTNYLQDRKKITLDYNGGVEELSETIQQVGTTYNLPTPTREGYTFLGWYKGVKKSANYIKNFANDGYNVLRLGPYNSYNIANSELTIEGDIVDFDVTTDVNVRNIDYNDGTVSNNNYEMNDNNIKGIILIDNTLSGNNYDFLDINTFDRIGSYTINKYYYAFADNKITNSTLVSNTDTELTAMWQKN